MDKMNQISSIFLVAMEGLSILICFFPKVMKST
jgi:hypothetical protein